MKLAALALAVLAAACGDDSATGQFFDAPADASDAIPDAIPRFDAPVGDPSGAWQAMVAPSNVYACFGTGSFGSGSVDFADTIAEVITTPCCSYASQGFLYFPNNMGTWTIDGLGRLVVTIDPPCGESCGPVTYEKLDTVDCTF